MKVVRFGQCAFGFAAGFALLAGCNASGSTPLLGGGSATPNGQRQPGIQRLNQMFAMTNPMHRGIPAQRHPIAHSWMRKAPNGTSGTLWATDIEYGSVDLIAYPSGTLIGQVSGFSFPYGDCSDKSGNVYVADFDLQEGFEIAAGSTSVINSWPTGGEAIGCSVSNSGDVAFTNFYPGGVVVFPGGGPTGHSYPGPGYDWSAGYDRHGNLFVECNDESPCSSPRLAELPAGSSSWLILNLNEAINFPGPVQNMGKYLGVVDQEVSGHTTSGIDLVDVSGSNATVVKTIVPHGGSCGTYLDFSGSWASINNKPNGVVTKKVKDIGLVNLDCFPTPISIYKAKNGDYIKSIGSEAYAYDYGLTFTKP